MAYDESLAERIRDVVGLRAGVTEKKMFGGLCFLIGGKMFCGITNDDLMVRVGPDGHEGALTRPHARPMDFTGRPMRGYVFVAPAGLTSDDELRSWVDLALSFASSLGGSARSTKRR